jgi:transcriptional regulator with XRE-family HTH domain
MIGTQRTKEILREMGARLRTYRLQQNLPVEEVAERSGLNRNTIGNAEAGRDPRLSTLVRILRVLGKLEALDAFLPPPPLSPMQLLETKGKPRKRARRSS